MYTESDVLSAIITYFTDELGLDLDPSAELRAVIDSLTTAELLQYLDERFGQGVTMNLDLPEIRTPLALSIAIASRLRPQ